MKNFNLVLVRQRDIMDRYGGFRPSDIKAWGAISNYSPVSVEPPAGFQKVVTALYLEKPTRAEILGAHADYASLYYEYEQRVYELEVRLGVAVETFLNTFKGDVQDSVLEEALTTYREMTPWVPVIFSGLVKYGSWALSNQDDKGELCERHRRQYEGIIKSGKKWYEAVCAKAKAP